jgi:hypothetical protein
MERTVYCICSTERRNVVYEKAPDLPERHWVCLGLLPSAAEAGHAIKRTIMAGAAIMVITHANIIGTITPTITGGTLTIMGITASAKLCFSVIVRNIDWPVRVRVG